MIGIISINRYSVHMNYGAALHSFAFQQYLDKQGIDNIIINYLPRFMDGYNMKYPICNNFRWKSILKWGIGFRANYAKYNKFSLFFQNHCRYTDKLYTDKTLDILNASDYDIDTFVCESDVIWKPSSTKGVDKGYFLSFNAANHCRKISYAASVGLYMTLKEKAEIKPLLQKFNAISVRENDSVKYIEQLSGKPVQWVIDPTLLLTKEDYTPFIKKPKETNYLLVYNCMNNDKRMLRIAKATAKKMNLKMIEISAFPENNVLYNHSVKTNLGIEEFLGYFAYASYIICNAFHGSCFAVIFEKNFNVFQREEHDYRLKSIISPLGIECTYISKNLDIDVLDPLRLDYKIINQKLNQFRSISHKYIMNALKTEL